MDQPTHKVKSFDQQSLDLGEGKLVLVDRRIDFFFQKVLKIAYDFGLMLFAEGLFLRVIIDKKALVFLRDHLIECTVNVKTC